MPPSLQGGTCSRAGCSEPRHLYSSGKYSFFCHEHTKEHARDYASKRRNEGLVIGGLLPKHVRIIARRCLKCGEKLPNTFEYFNHLRDKPPRWFWWCRNCDGSAEYMNLDVRERRPPDAPDPKTYPCPPCNGTGGVFKEVRRHMERVLCKECGGTGEVDATTVEKYRERQSKGSL